MKTAVIQLSDLALVTGGYRYGLKSVAGGWMGVVGRGATSAGGWHVDSPFTVQQRQRGFNF